MKRTMSYFAHLHSQVFEWATSFLERRPQFGYVLGAASSTAGLMTFVETTTKIVGLFAACVGLTVGIYTLRVQIRQLKKLEAEALKKT